MHDGEKKIKYHLQDKLLYSIDNLCVPKDDRLKMFREAHFSKVAGHFGVGKTMANL